MFILFSFSILSLYCPRASPRQHKKMKNTKFFNAKPQMAQGFNTAYSATKKGTFFYMF